MVVDDCCCRSGSVKGVPSVKREVRRGLPVGSEDTGDDMICSYCWSIETSVTNKSKGNVQMQETEDLEMIHGGNQPLRTPRRSYNPYSYL